METDRNKRLIDVTLGELLDSLKQAEQSATIDTTEKKLIHGIAGIAKFYGCSKTTISVWKSKGVFKKVIGQTGRKIVVSEEDLMKLAKELNIKMK